MDHQYIVELQPRSWWHQACCLHWYQRLVRLLCHASLGGSVIVTLVSERIQHICPFMPILYSSSFLRNFFMASKNPSSSWPDLFPPGYVRMLELEHCSKITSHWTVKIDVFFSHQCAFFHWTCLSWLDNLLTSCGSSGPLLFE